MENIQVKFESKVLYIFENGKKYDILERYFYFEIEEKKLRIEIDNLDLSEDEKREFCSELFYVHLLPTCKPFSQETYLLVKKIKDSFGLSNFEDYSKNQKTSIIDNPNLLGISPILFSTEDWKKFILHDIEKSNISSLNYYAKKIISCIDDALFRLDKDFFIISKTSENKSSFSGYTAMRLFSLIEDDIDSICFINYDNEVSTKDEIITDNLPLHSKVENRIVLTDYTTGELIDKLIEGFKGRALDTDQKLEIKKFVSRIFVNKKGKRHSYNENIDRDFIAENIKLFKNVLMGLTKVEKCEKNNKREINWSNKQISKLIQDVIPNHLNVKTIENY